MSTIDLLSSAFLTLPVVIGPIGVAALVPLLAVAALLTGRIIRLIGVTGPKVISRALGVRFTVDAARAAYA